jgi:aspartate oxidase
VFARRCASAALSDVAERQPSRLGADWSTRVGGVDVEDPRFHWQRLRTALWEGAGVVRDAGGLAHALDVCHETAAACEAASTRAARRLGAASLTATLVCSAALHREETRGCHIRSDFPESSEPARDTEVVHIERGGRLDGHL